MPAGDDRFEASCHAEIGFEIQGVTSINVDADAGGGVAGVRGRCLDPGDGDGVQGFGSAGAPA